MRKENQNCIHSNRPFIIQELEAKLAQLLLLADGVNNNTRAFSFCVRYGEIFKNRPSPAQIFTESGKLNSLPYKIVFNGYKEKKILCKTTKFCLYTVKNIPLSLRTEAAVRSSNQTP